MMTRSVGDGLRIPGRYIAGGGLSLACQRREREREKSWPAVDGKIGLNRDKENEFACREGEKELRKKR